MKLVMFSICFLSIFTMLNASETIDFFKFENNSSTAKLYFKSHKDPELIKNGRNFTVLFKENYFPDEKSTLAKDSTFLMKKLTIKNYENKGGALNILGKTGFNGKIKRIAPDVVTITLTPFVSTAPRQIVKPINVASTEPKIVKKKIDKPIKTEDKELKALISSISKDKIDKGEKKEEISNNPIYILLGITSLIFGILFLINKKKKVGRLNNKNGKLMNIVETMQIGLKEKLLLVKVGQNYVMLFASDKDMKPMATFDQETIGGLNSEIENIQIKTETKRPQTKKNVNSFQKKISSMISESNEKRDRSSAEEELYATLGRLRKVAAK